MGRKLSDSLTQFISSAEDGFQNPFDDNESTQENDFDVDEFLEEREEIRKQKKEKKKEKKKRRGTIEDLYERTKSLSDELGSEDMVDDFDGYLREYALDDEDEELRRSLIKQGRKYARDTKISGESSEIQKAYAQSEEILETLLKEVNEDKESIQKDINQMRVNRSRNYKTFSEMMEQRTTLHNTTLGIVKELNAMKKNQIELQMKVDKNKQEEDGDDTAANRAIQSLFGMGRDALIGSYSDVSGADAAGSYSDDDYDPDDSDIQERYFSDEEYQVETDGDKFIKYEGMGVHYILEYDDDGPVQIVAEDMDGNVVPAYPIPDLGDLSFNISENTGTATDNLSQKYDLRKI